MRVYMSLFACVLFLTAARSNADDRVVPQLLQTHLSLDLTLNYDKGTIDGEATLTLKNVGTKPVEVVPFQLGRLMQISDVVGSDGRPLSFTQDVVTYEDWPKFQVNQAYVSPASPIAAGEARFFTIRYGGLLVGYTETGMQYVRDHVDREFTIIRTDARAFPMVTEPSIESLRAQPRADFAYDARITVPAGLTVATGAPESEQIADGDLVTWVFAGSDLVPFLNIAIAPYEQLEDGGVRVFYFPADSLGARMVMRAIGEASKLYARWFGPLAGGVRLHVMEIPEGWGSQASLTGGIIQTADAFHDNRRLTSLYHELSHLWNVAELDRPSCRWNEGLAMFLQQRVAVELDQAENLAPYMARVAESRRESLKKTPELASVPFSQYGQHDMTDYSYRTGQLMFYVLYSVMGEAGFDAALRGYRETYGQAGSTTAQFADYLKQEAPGPAARVLDDWFQSTMWAERLAAGESLEKMISGYSE